MISHDVAAKEFARMPLLSGPGRRTLQRINDCAIAGAARTTVATMAIMPRRRIGSWRLLATAEMPKALCSRLAQANAK
jgi:hypothetical protein